MNTDGSDLQQLTHFRTPGYPEFHEGIAVTGFRTPDGSTIYAQSLIFPDYENWIIEFAGNCGNMVTAVDETPSPHALKLYPNPVQNTLIVQTDIDMGLASAKIFNALGQMVKSIPVMPSDQMRIPVEDLGKGIYFLEMQVAGEKVSRVFVKN